MEACIEGNETIDMKDVLTQRVLGHVLISNKLGLHVRAAAKLVQIATGFVSTISIRYDGKEADAKSIMSIMMLAATCGVEVELEANGADAREAIKAIDKLFVERFGESE